MHMLTGARATAKHSQTSVWIGRSAIICRSLSVTFIKRLILKAFIKQDIYHNSLILKGFYKSMIHPASKTRRPAHGSRSKLTAAIP
ncbi:MAG: hypothetical protein KIT18_04865 [Burkholderiales bacterium]|nr:hypothetical protein [Burkholderiales bacterium]